MRRLAFHVALALLPPLAAADARAAKLTVRVTDADTGRAMPARLSLRASDGSYPGDRLALSAASWPGIEAHAVFIAGERTFDLPPGETSVLAARGPQYTTDGATVQLKDGAPAAVHLQLRRVIDLRTLGWVGGDAHLHMIHGEMQRPTSYEDVARTCRAGGLDWALVNQEYVGAGRLDLAGYKAACARVSTPDFRLMLGGERPKSLLGHAALIGVDNPFVIPDDPPYHAAARVVHAQGGVLFPVHPVRYFPDKKYLGRWLDFPGNNLARELVFDAFLGPSFDGLSVLSDEPAGAAAHGLWFNLLNRGLFVPAAADSDACFDRPTFGFHAPGFWITYVHTGGATDPAALAGAFRAGRTFATTGPVVLFDIDGQPSGSTLPPDGTPRKVRIRALHPHHLWSLQGGKHAGVARVELVRNGQVVRSWEPNRPEAELTTTVAEAGPCWYAARVYGADRQWQVAVASPVYFAKEPMAPKREPLAVSVRGRVYDFESGRERRGTVEVRRGTRVLKRFDADGQFKVRIPLDAELSVAAPGVRPVVKRLLLDHGPVHEFLWHLTSADLAKAETFDRFESLVREVELEFPLGHRMPGCYFAARLDGPRELGPVAVLDGPPPIHDPGGATAVAAVLLDKESVAPGDTLHVAALFRYEGDRPRPPDARLVVEGRAFCPAEPTGFNPLKLFGTVEENWSKARDVGRGYRMVAGALKVPGWADPGPVGAVEVNVRSRGEGGKDGCFVGLRVPLGKTRHALAVCSGWPTMPLSWPDHNYGIGPLRVCGKAGREGQPRADYRTLHLVVTAGQEYDVLPARDGRGCADADDAVYTGHFFDQVLNKESRLAERDPVRPQPAVEWRDVPLIDATR